jgi:ATP-dependent Clp protease protease subunit
MKGATMPQAPLADAGVLTLAGPVSHDRCQMLIEKILSINLEAECECIRLYINSPGGDVDQGFALIDIMRWSRIPIHTTAMGCVASMGLLVLMAGAPGGRTVMPSCSLMSHRFAGAALGTHADLVAARVQQDLLHRRILDHYRLCTGVQDDTALEADLLRPTDRWLTPVEAVALGIADRVWDPKGSPR